MSSILSVVVVNVVAQSRHTTKYFIFRFSPQERGKTDFVFWTASSSKIDPR